MVPFSDSIGFKTRLSLLPLLLRLLQPDFAEGAFLRRRRVRDAQFACDLREPSALLGWT
jgi:hypothetical protein